MSLTEALNPIKVFGKQAMSYGGSVARSAIRTSSSITKNALSHGLAYYTVGGAVVGAAAGGYDAYESGRSTVGGALRGAGYGAAGGAALRLGMSAINSSGRRSLRAFGGSVMGGVGGGMSGAAARAAGSTNYFTAMRQEFAASGGFGRMGSSIKGMSRRAANSTAGVKIAGMAGTAYGKGINVAESAVDAIRSIDIGSEAGSAYGRAVHASTGFMRP